MDENEEAKVKMQNALKTLKRKRSARRGVITRLLNEFESIREPAKIEIENLLLNLARYKSEILILDEEILNLLDEDLDDESMAELLHDNDSYLNDINIKISELKVIHNQIVELNELKLNEDRKSTRLNSSHRSLSRMPSSA